MPRLPEWFKVSLPADAGALRKVAQVLREHRLHSVCTSAKCPNLAECWQRGTATIMVLGNRCTRACRFCAVEHAREPLPPDAQEPARVARAVESLGLKLAVVTAVTRDDLPDGGAAHLAAVVRAVRSRCPAVGIELLVPDFRGSLAALDLLAAARPDVAGHNLECVRRLTPLVRDVRASYDGSLAVLQGFAGRGLCTKTALLLGLGETDEELEETLRDARAAGVRHVAMGQYLAPSSRHVPVARYRTPEVFARLGARARSLGFESVACGPRVRSSYRAEQFSSPAPRLKLE
jgi:lipoic acid synthetase